MSLDALLQFLRRLCLAALFWAMAAPAFASAGWTGTWDTRWEGGGARMELKQDGTAVQGVYPSYNGAINGQLTGPVLKGRWSRGPHSGAVEFVMAPDGESFVGRYDNGQWWTGGRVTLADQAVRINQSSPRAALRTFLNAGNAARYDAPDQYALAASVLDTGDKAMPPEQKVETAKVLFELVDQTTFRLFTLPDKSITDDSFTVKLQQAGTDAALPLSFVRKNGLWFIVRPDDAALDAAHKALFARSGGHPPLPEAYKARRNARDAVRAFERAFFDWDRGGQEQARDALDLASIPEAVRAYEGDLTSLYLNGILNRVGVLEPQEISDDPNTTEPYVVFSHPRGRIVVAPSGSGAGASWKYDADTVAHARDIFVVVEDMPPLAGQKLPVPASSFMDLRREVRDVSPSLLAQAGPLELWQIVGWVAVLAVAAAIGIVLAWTILRLLTPVFGGAPASASRRTIMLALWGTLTFSLYKLMIPAIGLPDVAKRFSVGVTGTALVLCVMWLGWVLLSATEDRLVGRADGAHPAIDNILVSLAFGFLKLVLLAGGATAIAVELSLPYEGIIASLSIGGLAVAFASRETLSNIFGAGVLAIDRPFRRGDYISAGGTSGVVEHVGVRSTRVRADDDSMIIMPNGKLADAMVNNLGTRRYHLKQATLPLPLTTTAGQIEAFISGVRKLIAGHPDAAQDKTSVAVSAISKDGIDVNVKYAIDARRSANETDVANELTLAMLRLCESLQIRNGAPV